MSERLPNEQPMFSLELNGIRYEFTPDNTAAFLHEQEPHFDHIYYAQDGGWMQLYRRSVGNFDEIISFMEKSGYEVHNEVFASQNDKQLYFDTFGFELSTRELTPREEHKIAFARYLMDNCESIEELLHGKA